MNSSILLEQAQSNLIMMGQDVRRRLNELAEMRRAYGLDVNQEALWCNEVEMLRRIEVAQQGLESGQYGRCRHCHQPIDPERLLLVPYTDSCMGCNFKIARRQLRQN